MTSAPFIPDILLRAVDAGLPAIAWMATGASPGDSLPKRYLFTFGVESVHVQGSDQLQRMQEELPPDEPFGCGFVFLLPYGSLHSINGDAKGAPVTRVLRVDACYIVDLEQRTGNLVFSAEASPQRRKEFSDAVLRIACAASPKSRITSPVQARPCIPFEEYGELSRAEYEATVLRIQEDILAGRYYELNFTQRFSITSPRSPHELATALFSEPAKHAAFMDMGNEWILSNSPELFLRVENRVVLTGPIKGTCSAGEAAPFPIGGKDHAEHTMVLDMARNDLGRVCETGSVRVRDGYCIEHHRHLLHLVSAVEGRVCPGITTRELLEATFPAASISGAPKIEVMAAIQEYERSPRNLYTGSIGWCGNDYLELNVAIRTLLVQRAGGAYQYRLGSGGAVVAESTPSKEYEECLLKIMPFFQLISPGA